MISETEPFQLKNEKIVENKKRVNKKKEPKTIEVTPAVEACPVVEETKPKPKRGKKQKEDIDDDANFNRVKDILSKNPNLVNEIEDILKKHLK